MKSLFVLTIVPFILCLLHELGMKGLKNFREVVTVGDAEADINPLVTAVSPIHKLPVRPSYSANSTYQLMHFSIQYFYAITRFHKMQGLVK